MNLDNLTLYGTSHISKHSVEGVRKIILEDKPDIVCLELDKARFFSLQSNAKTKIGIKEIFKLGLKGYLFAIIGSYVQKKLGNIVKTDPGSEMKEVMKLAKENNFKIMLIDRDIRITLKRFSKAWGVKETLVLMKEFIVGIFKPRKLKFGLSEVPSEEVIDELVLEVKEKFPSIYEVLIEERNIYMAKNIAKLMKKFPESKILSVVGAGHKKDMIELLKHRFE